MRLFTLLLLLCFAVLLSVPYGLYVLPGLSPETGMALALAIGIILAIVVRVIFLAIIGSLVTAIGLFVLITLASQYFFFAIERDRWFGNQNELPQRLPVPERESAYLTSIGLEQKDNPVLNWLNHSRFQAESGLSARNLTANQVGAPRAKQTPEDVWLGWLYQVVALLASLIIGAILGRRRKAKAKRI